MKSAAYLQAKSLNLDARSDYGGFIPAFPETILTGKEKGGIARHVCFVAVLVSIETMLVSASQLV